MKYDTFEEKEKLEQVNEELVKFMRDYPKDKLSLTAIGNSISNGFSMSEPGKLLLDRNLGLIDFGKSEGIDVQTYHLTRSENNNALAVSNWIIQNCCENDTHNWNKADYERAIKSGHPLLTEEQINEYFSNGSNKKVQDVIFDTDSKNANIVILNLGTGSFLDVVTRHGSLSIPNLLFSIDRDVCGIHAILELIQNNNRKNSSKTQIYLCGAPRIANTVLSDIFMNPKAKKIGKTFANVTYVPSFPRQAFYKTPDGSIIPDPHYNQAEYYHFLAEIENKIIDNYLIRDLMIDLDRVLYYMSNENDINGTSFTRSDAKDVIDEIAKKYESKTGNYNYFIDFIKGYIKGRYPFDFYRVSSDGNLSDDLDDMKKKK
ncbi:MAG: hypothetical protein IKE10_03425 [Bacilli bacterium]|nr:hypothetical protein [Bacilli bacterium]